MFFLKQEMAAMPKKDPHSRKVAARLPGDVVREAVANTGATGAEAAAHQNLLKTRRMSRRVEVYISNPRRALAASADGDDDDALVAAVRHVGAAVAARARRARRRAWRENDAAARAAAADRSPLLSASARPTPRELVEACRFTDTLPLRGYAGRMRYTPQVVNCVSLATVRPTPGSATTVPLDLAHIASSCTGAYFAPRRFAAVQLAQISPRARVLVFSGQDRPGQMVVIGASGVVSARLALMQARAQLAEEAGVHVDIVSFKTINMVGHVSLGATVNCEAFAQAHTDTVHYDRSSFVGLTWRPPGAPCCVEIYSTGSANIPGAKSYRSLLTGFSALVGELLVYSSSGGGNRISDDGDDDGRMEEVEEVEDAAEDAFAGWDMAGFGV